MSQKPQIQNIYGLSPMQEGMLFHSLLDSDSSAYFEQMSFTLEGIIDLPKFEEAFNAIMARYDILRTIFKFEKVDKPLQIVLKERSAKIRYEDIRHLDAADQEIAFEQLKVEDRKKGFDLARNILLRLTVVQFGDSAYKAIWSHHHILMDGWCLGIIIKEFVLTYDALKANKPAGLPAVVPYSNYISWLEKRDREQTKAFWQQYLSGYEKQVTIPQLSGSRTSEFLKGKTHFVLSKDLTVAIQQLAADYKVTSNIILQAVWGLVLQRYNYTNDAVFGAVVSGRPPEINGVESIIGLFINTIPVRVRLEENMTFVDLIKQLQKASVESTQHDYYPLAEIQALSDLKGELINNIIVFENYPVGKKIERSEGEKASIIIKGVEIFEQTNYGLIMVVVPDGTLNIKLEYNQHLYSADTIERVRDHFVHALGAVTASPQRLLSAMDMIPEKEKTSLLDIYEGR